MSKNKLIIGLVILSIIDVFIPIPITGFLLIYGILEKPAWFQEILRII